MVQMNILIYNWGDIKNPGAGGAEMFMHEDVKWVEKENKVTLFISAFAGYKREEFVCEPNQEAMVERVVELLQDDMLRERLSRNALAWIGEFDWERSTEELLKAVMASA